MRAVTFKWYCNDRIFEYCTIRFSTTIILRNSVFCYTFQYPLGSVIIWPQSLQVSESEEGSEEGMEGEEEVSSCDHLFQQMVLIILASSPGPRAQLLYYFLTL